MVAIAKVREAHVQHDGAHQRVEERQRIQSSGKHLSMGRASWLHN